MLLDVAYDIETGELKEEESPCPICSGAGAVSAFLYPAARREA